MIKKKIKEETREESTINRVMGNLLNEMRPSWHARGQNRQTLKSGKQPDILITESGMQTLVIENEFGNETQVDIDATNKLGETHYGKEIQLVLGVRIPTRFKRLLGDEDLKRDMKTCDDLEYALFRVVDTDEGVGNSKVCEKQFMDKNTQKEKIIKYTRFPSHGLLQGNLFDIMAAAHLSMMSSRSTTQAVDFFIDGILQAEKILQDVNPDIEKKIGCTLLQPPGRETRLMACFVMLNSVLFHDHVAITNSLPTRFDHIILGASVNVGKLYNTWEQILKKDYYPIFSTAHKIIRLIGSNMASDILEILFGTADKIIGLSSEGSSDMYGEVFQQTISERKMLAANYTRPTCAAMLAAMIFPLPTEREYYSTKQVENIHVADFACGTGILLLAAYRTLAMRYEMNEKKSMSNMHNRMMSECIIGADVLPLAAHQTASALAGMYPDQKFDNTRIYPVQQGPNRGGMDKDGGECLDDAYGDYKEQEEPDAQQARTLMIGSLEWIQAETQTLDESMLRLTSEKTIFENKIPPHASCDIVIMNPPYSANKSPGASNNANNPGILFSAFGATKKQIRSMANHAKKLYTNKPCANTKAGLGTFFTDLMHVKLKPGGRFGMVLPMTAATGTTWANFRQFIAANYTNVTVTCILGVKQDDISMSGGTDMTEILVTGTKKENDTSRNQATTTGTDIGSDNIKKKKSKCRGIFLALEHRPSTLFESHILGTRMHTTTASKIEDPVTGGGTSLMPGASDMLIDAPLETDKWYAVGVRDYRLIQIAYTLQTQNMLRMSQMHCADIPMTTLGSIATVGPSHLQIVGVNKNNKKAQSFNGPFRWPESYNDLISHHAFWGLEPCTNTMLQKPNRSLSIIPGMKPSHIEHIIQRASANVHIRSNLRTTSECITMSHSIKPAIGGNGWPSVLIEPRYAKALVLWSNSTLGILCRWFISNREQLGRSLIGISDTGLLAVPNFTKLTAKQVTKFDKYFDKLSMRKLDRILNGYKDETRIAIDDAILDVFDIGFDIDDVRLQLCREYTINGGKMPQDEG